MPDSLDHSLDKLYKKVLDNAVKDGQLSLLDQLAEEIRMCQRCELRQNATCPVPGHGSIGAKYFLIGEAPGASEDEAGVPFVGQAGRKLDKLLGLAGIDINDCYLSNVLRCRTPNNKDPRKKEIRACVDFLWREIKLVEPQYVITLGSVPLSLFCPYGIRQMHGTQIEVEIPDGGFVLKVSKEGKGKKAKVEEKEKEDYATSVERLFSSSL